jgi:hypothetical protein
MNILFLRIGFSLLFGAVGIYLLTVAWRVFLSERALKLGGASTEGEIVAFKESASPGRSAASRTLLAPVVTFTAQGGIPMRITSSMAQSPNPYTIGQKVRVRYLAHDPTAADLEAAASSSLPLVVLLVLAVVALCVAALPFVLPPPAHG